MGGGQTLCLWTLLPCIQQSHDLGSGVVVMALRVSTLGWCKSYQALVLAHGLCTCLWPCVSSAVWRPCRTWAPGAIMCMGVTSGRAITRFSPKRAIPLRTWPSCAQSARVGGLSVSCIVLPRSANGQTPMYGEPCGLGAVASSCVAATPCAAPRLGN